MRAEVPVFKWLSMTAKMKQYPYMQLSFHRIQDGKVLFDDGNMHILKTVLQAINTSGCPRCQAEDSTITPHEGINWRTCHSCGERWDPEVRLPEHFEGKIPVFPKSKPKKEYTGVDARTVSSHLEGWHQKDAEWYACRCPVHMGQSVNSMVVSVRTGAFFCHQGCSSTDIYKVLKGFAPKEAEQ